MLFGKTPDEAAASSVMPAIPRRRVHPSRSEMLAHQLGFAVDAEPTVTHEVAVATAPIDSPIGAHRARPGRGPEVSAGRRPSDGTPVVEVRTNWFMGEDRPGTGMDVRARGESGSRSRSTGDPSTQLTVRGWHPESIAAGLARNPGIVATANHCVSAVPAVVAADPGIATYLDLPMYTGSGGAPTSAGNG